ncbi:ECF transporter S component [Anoxybacter fermentans]|uniref:ECF transporter S component n=1 Tax=Anoxybacter fermentans TaxID=1323375 RepID=A0A3S9SVY7_9FIRM|nr:ECF transporter S component [Anoxybacter fermentans]AZR72476.1 ECF transporter S component [Anoxybacter fermentans]
MKLKTRDMVISGILGGIAIFLGQTGFGFIPLPTGINATIMHLPVIIGAVLEGPVVGTLVGLIFGLFSWIQARNPFFADPTISVLPRLFIGIITYFSYQSLKRFNDHVAMAVAGVIGSLTNTVLVLGMIFLKGYMPFDAVVPIAFIHGIPEAIVAAIVTYFVCLGVKRARELKFDGGN